MRKPEKAPPATPGSDEALLEFPRYTGLVEERLQKGKAVYGDESFELPMAELIREIQEELMDVSGWAFIAWRKLEKLKLKINAREGQL